MELFQAAAELREQNKPFAIATIVSSKGSTPRTNAKMIVINKDTIIGTIGGGLAESYIIKESVDCLKTGQSKMVGYTLDSGTSKTSIAMTCGGDLEVFIEVIVPRPELLIIGGGHVALQIARLAETLDYCITIVENRKDFLTEERFPMARQLFYHKNISKAAEMAHIDKNTYIVICTGSVDEAALRTVINSDAAYIGLLSSRRKISLIMNHMKDDDFDEHKLASVFAPIGLDLKAETPEEIAFSILSEIRMIQTGSTGRSIKQQYNKLIIVRGGGDIASGSIARLYNAGYKIIVLEIAEPTVIRSSVAFSQAMYDGSTTINGITAIKAETEKDIKEILLDRAIPVINDPKGKYIDVFKPVAVVDGILAKKNLGTSRDMAPVVIGLGPGFDAGVDVDAVIETNRGHNLGRVIFKGKPEPNTGVPGVIGGEAGKRVVRSTAPGRVDVKKKIGDLVKEGDILAKIGESEVKSQLDGVLRGIIHDGMVVPEKGFKIGDVDTRGSVENCFTISDKARAVGGGTLEAVLALMQPKKQNI
jgi:xanthine dehydrogenase accessory factor